MGHFAHSLRILDPSLGLKLHLNQIYFGLLNEKWILTDLKRKAGMVLFQKPDLLNRISKAPTLIAIIISLIGGGSLAYAMDWEPYSTRPDILSTEFAPPKSKGTQTEKGSGSKRPAVEDKLWHKLLRAHIEAVAEILTMYPNHRFYFLARDSEYLYDTAKLLTRDKPELSDRIHLLNVSRANIDKPDDLKGYLKQEKISEDIISAAKPILLVDTGFKGTIPEAISKLFKPEQRPFLQTHLMCSGNPDHPSNRAFLTAISETASRLDPMKMHGAIMTYEGMPHWTDRSSKFELVSTPDGGKRYEPMSIKPKADGEMMSDGKVSREFTLETMKKIRAFVESDEAKSLFKERSETWKELKTALEEKKDSALIPRLNALIETKEPSKVAIAKDFLETIRRNFKTMAAPIAEYRYDQEGMVAAESGLSKQELMKSFKGYQEYLTDDPAAGIHKLIKGKDFATLRDILGAIKDHPFMSALCKTLIDQMKDSNIVKDRDLLKEIRLTAKAIIQKGFPLEEIARIFSLPSTKNWKEELNLLIQSKESKVYSELVEHAFVQPHSKDWGKELTLITKLKDDEQSETIGEVIDDELHNKVAILLFSQPHSAGWGEALTGLIKGTSFVTHQDLAMDVFSQPHSVKWKGQLRLLIEMGGPNVREYLAKDFSKPHAEGWKEDFRFLLEMYPEEGHPDNGTIEQFLKDNPHRWPRAECEVFLKALKVQVTESNPNARKIFMDNEFNRLSANQDSSSATCTADSQMAHPSSGQGQKLIKDLNDCKSPIIDKH